MNKPATPQELAAAATPPVSALATPPGTPPAIPPAIPPATPPVTGPLTAPATPPPTKPTTKPTAPTDIATLLDEPAQRPWWRRWPVWAAVVVVLALAVGGYFWRAHSLSAAAPSYSTTAVARGDITLVVTANGTIQPTRTINIGSELSGTVLKVNVDVNDAIKKGQVLVQLDTAKLRDQITRSEAAVASAMAKVAETEATVAQSRATLGRFEAVAVLSGGKVPAKTELDVARATLARSVAEDGVSRAAVQDARAGLSTDRINLSKASITAPANGVVLTRTVDPGNAVAASLQAVTLFTVAEDLTKLRVWVYVDEADVGSVKLGQDATFTVSAYAGRNFPARITRVGQGSTITDNVVTYLTYLDVDNADLSLRPGMTATASITATQRKDVLLVPNSALRYTPSTAADGAKKGIASGIAFGPPKVESRRKGAADTASTAAARQVWVLPADAKGGPATGTSTGVPVAVAVVPGISDGHMTEIIGGDLKLGMQVVTAQKTAAAK